MMASRVAWLVFFVLCSSRLASAQSASCPIDAKRIELTGLGEACAETRSDVCESCVCFLAEAILDAGYDFASLDLNACALENISVLLANGATIAGFLRVYACPQTRPNCLSPPTPTPTPTIGLESPPLSVSPPTPPIPTEWLRGGSNTNGSGVYLEAFGAIDPTNETVAGDSGSKAQIAFGAGLGSAIALFILCGFLYHRYRMFVAPKLRMKYAHLLNPCQYPLSLELRNCTCGNREKLILQDINFSVRNGQLVGILGPSGCGKTTLLNAIVHGDMVTKGSVTICGEKVDVKRHRIAFVPQKNGLIHHLSVFETIYFAARLRLPWFFDDVKERTNRVIHELGLENVADAYIGATLSGGELRRTCIAAELICDPEILILDEPASGLDAHAAQNVFSTLRNLARDKEKAVVVSVHQPSRRILMNFDVVLLLGPTGRMLWNGSPHDLDDILSHIGMEPPLGVSTTEWLLDIACEKEVQFLEKVTAYEKLRSTSKTCETIVRPNLMIPARETVNASSIITQFHLVTWRSCVTAFRDRGVLISHWIIPILIGILLGALTRASDDLEGFQNRMGAVFFLLTFFALSAMTFIDIINVERPVIVQQIRSQYYHQEVYFISKLLSDWFLLRVCPTVLSVSAFYFLMGLRDSFSAFMTFLGLVLLFVFVQSSTCAVMAFSSKSTAAATLANTVVLLTTAVFAGYLINIKRLPTGSGWVAFFSPFFYAWGGCLASEMKGGPYLFNAVFGSSSVEVPVSGQTYLNVIGVEFDDVERNFIGIVLLLLGLIVIGLITLRFRVKFAQRE